MLDHGPIETAAPAQHPAVAAWQELGSAVLLPKMILELKGGKRKSAVYRLLGAGPDGSDVIAKRCRRSAALVERTVYEDVLPRLPVSGVHYFGSVEEGAGEFVWLFLEDAGDEGYSPADPEHRRLVARWLALAHTSCAGLLSAVELPDRGLAFQRAVLRSARATIADNLGNPALTADDAALLEKIMAHCSAVDSHWAEVEGTCAAMPRTLVHGDFGGKNVRVRRDPSGLTLLPVDWEQAGWGVPAADLSRVDAVTYLSTVERHWPQLDLSAVERLINVGKMLWCFAAVPGEAFSLGNPWPSRVMGKMVYYHSLLSEATRNAGWG